VTDSANVELVRSIFADWERGDFSAVEWADPAIEWMTVDGPAPGRWIGVAGMQEASRDWLNAWEGYRVDAYEYRDLDGERVLALFRYFGQGKISGMALEDLGMKGAGIFHIRGGKVTGLLAYWDSGRAFADLGLAQEGDDS
jgi:ketosteroid isomerase-like protein